MWVRLRIFSQLCITQYVGLCVFSLPISFVMIETTYMLCLIIIIKSEVWIITHCLGLGHETMVCAVCLFIFLWELDICLPFIMGDSDNYNTSLYTGYCLQMLFCLNFKRVFKSVWLSYLLCNHLRHFIYTLIRQPYAQFCARPVI